MSTAKPMTAADRQARYEKQNGRSELTDRQARHIRKTARRLEHGRKSSYAHWLRNAYGRWLRDARRQNPRAKLGRYTPKGNR